VGNNSEGTIVDPDEDQHDWVLIDPVDAVEENNKDKDDNGLPPHGSSEMLMSDEEATVVLRRTTDEILALDPPILKLLCEWLGASSIAGSKALLEALQERQRLQKEGEELERQIHETRKRRASSFGFIGRMLFELVYAAPSRGFHA
jgi:hypothetical protein